MLDTAVEPAILRGNGISGADNKDAAKQKNTESCCGVIAGR
jgi:hypothetical protein